VQKYGNQVPPYRETQTYVVRVLDFYQQYKGGSLYNTAYNTAYSPGATGGSLAYNGGYAGSAAGYGNRSSGVTVITPRTSTLAPGVTVARGNTGSATIPRTYMTPTGTRIIVGGSGAGATGARRPPVVYSVNPDRAGSASNRNSLFAGNDK